MTELLREAYSPELFKKRAYALIDLLAGHLNDMASGHKKGVIAWKEPTETLDYWKQDFKKPRTDNPELIFSDILNQTIHLHHPNYMGHQAAVPLPLAALAHLFTGLLNPGMPVYEMGMASSSMEKVIMEMLSKKIGYAENSSGILTSGGTLGTLTALLTARAVKSPGDVWKEGTNGKLAIIVSEEAHYCIDRAARIMGLGDEGIIKIPVNENYQMRTDLLEQFYQKARQEGLSVIAVIGSVCNTATGAYDNCDSIADFCEKNNLWFHADGAHGGAVVFSEKYKHLVNGVNRADSIVIDFHKMLLTPALTTGVVFKDGSASYTTFRQKADYLLSNNQNTEEWFNIGKRTFECTKSMMVAKVYLTLRVYGEAIFEDNVNTLYDLGTRFAEMILSRRDLELPLRPQSNIVCFRHKKDGLSNEKLNALNQLIREKLIKKGDFYIVQTLLKGNIYLRVSLMNPLTEEINLEGLLNAIEEIIAEIPVGYS